MQLLAAYFTSGPPTEYSGNFKVERRSLQQSVDDLFRESALPGLGGARLAIVHDNSKLGVRSTYRGVDLHLVPKPEMPLHQARWRAYLQAFGANAFARSSAYLPLIWATSGSLKTQGSFVSSIQRSCLSAPIFAAT